MRTISQKQFNELQERLEFNGADSVFFVKLQHLTGITAHPYIRYTLYDEDGNYLCDSEDIDLNVILRDAGIDIRKE